MSLGAGVVMGILVVALTISAVPEGELWHMSCLQWATASCCHVMVNVSKKPIHHCHHQYVPGS